MALDLLIGVVTHPRTRFPASAGEQGLAARLRSGIEAQGASCAIAIHDTDDHTDALLMIDREEIARSIDCELTTERRWRAYLRPGRTSLAAGPWFALRRARRRQRYLPRAGALARPDDAGVRMVRRLVNIELAHLDLMRQALETGARWALILEDDATADASAAVACAADLVDLMRDREAHRAPQYVNLSRSFAQSHLGIEHLLAPVPDWQPSHEPGVAALSAAIPVTNTVCAVLYRAEFLRALLAMFDRISLSPVQPIDWKLNAALMAMVEDGSLGPGDCWFLTPGPIVQGSMQ